MTDSSKNVHYSAEVLARTRYFVRTDEHRIELPWWTTRFHQCRSLIEAKANFPGHVVDAVELTAKVAAIMSTSDRDYVVLDGVGMFKASAAAAHAARGGNSQSLFYEVCAWLGGMPGWVNAWFVGEDGSPNWMTEQHEELIPDMWITRAAAGVLS
jgi:hypothetical protein